MARRFLSKREVFELLRQEVNRAGSQKAWANKNGYDRTVLNSILSGRKEITAPLIKLLNLRTAYVPALPRQDCEILDEEGVLRMLRADVERTGSQRRWARHYGSDRAALNMVLLSKKPLTIAIIKALNLKTVYVLN